MKRILSLVLSIVASVALVALCFAIQHATPLNASPSSAVSQPQYLADGDPQPPPQPPPPKLVADGDPQPPPQPPPPQPQSVPSWNI